MPAKKGVKFSEEHKKHMSESSAWWKGDLAGYSAKHRWVVAKFGKARRCELCGTTKAKRYHWANTDHKYKRYKKYWKQMCASCHIKYDINQFGRGYFNN